MMLKSLKELSLNYYIVLSISLLILAFAYLAPFKIALNLSESLPQKYFLIIKGKLPEKGEYACFKNKNSNQFYSHPFIKQVIGVSNDEIKQINNNYWIASSQYPFITPAGLAKEYSLKGERLIKNSTRIIPPNHYYVYASHKDSLDSRYQEIGLIHKSHIIGKAIPLTLTHLIYSIIILGLMIALYLRLVKLLLNLTIPTYLRLGKVTITLILLNNVIINSHAKDLGVHGKIYNIIETDLSQNIQNKLTSLEESGELKKLQKQWQKQAIQRAERPKAVEGLSKAVKTREYTYDPSVTSNKDIFDHQGNIIIKKGTKVNPLHYQNLPQRLLFINGDDDLQVKWALKKSKQHQSLIVLTKGNVMQLMRDNRARIYFDQNGHLIKTFNIQNLPAEIYQEKDILKVREVVI